MMTSTNDHLIRSQLWSSQLKEIFEDYLIGQKFVNWRSDFTDGDTLNIPSIGQFQVNDYAEGQSVTYNSVSSGNFQLSVTDYVNSGFHITRKMMQDSYQAAQIMAKVVPGQALAIAKRLEADIFAVGPDGQTASDYNLINGARHRFVGGGTNEVISMEDFVYARYALQKANVPLDNLIAIVDPTVELQLNKLPIGNYDNSPQWEKVQWDGIGTGMKFVRNIHGFDVYCSHFLKQNLSETIGGVTASTGVANLFFSNSGDASPFTGVMRQNPIVDSEFNKDLQREEYVTTARWGLGLYRPESLVTVITDTDQAYA